MQLLSVWQSRQIPCGGSTAGQSRGGGASHLAPPHVSVPPWSAIIIDVSSLWQYLRSHDETMYCPSSRLHWQRMTQAASTSHHVHESRYEPLGVGHLSGGGVMQAVLLQKSTPCTFWMLQGSLQNFRSHVAGTMWPLPCLHSHASRHEV